MTSNLEDAIPYMLYKLNLGISALYDYQWRSILIGADHIHQARFLLWHESSHFLSEWEGNCVGTGHVMNTQTLYSTHTSWRIGMMSLWVWNILLSKYCKHYSCKFHTFCTSLNAAPSYTIWLLGQSPKQCLIPKYGITLSVNFSQPMVYTKYHMLQAPAHTHQWVSATEYLSSSCWDA